MSTLLAIMIGMGIAIENRLGRGTAGGGGGGTSLLFLEDGASYFLLENGTDRIQLEA